MIELLYGSDFITPFAQNDSVGRVDEAFQHSSNMVNWREGVMKSDPYWVLSLKHSLLNIGEYNFAMHYESNAQHSYG